MQYSEYILIDLYSWCFSSTPDTVANGLASSADGIRFTSISQQQEPDLPAVWSVSAQSESFNITSFETDLSTCIDIFKQAWTNKDNPI